MKYILCGKMTNAGGRLSLSQLKNILLLLL